MPRAKAIVLLYGGVFSTVGTAKPVITDEDTEATIREKYQHEVCGLSTH